MILNFLVGNQTDYENRYIQDIWEMNDHEIENTHNFIQWIFPLNEKSGAIPNSPILSTDDILKIKKSEVAKNNIKKSSNWFLNFLERNKYWICYSNHNHLRVTRAIKSLRLIHSNKEAEKFKTDIMNLIEGNEDKISSLSLEFWKNS